MLEVVRSWWELYEWYQLYISEYHVLYIKTEYHVLYISEYHVLKIKSCHSTFLSITFWTSDQKFSLPQLFSLPIDSCHVIANNIYKELMRLFREKQIYWRCTTLILSFSFSSSFNLNKADGEQFGSTVHQIKMSSELSIYNKLQWDPLCRFHLFNYYAVAQSTCKI